jgi:nitrile hydratase
VDGIHDLGGMEGFGRVVLGPADEPPFPEAWHGRVHGMLLALAVNGALGSGFRYAIERMDPAEYLGTSYYEHWLHAVETRLVENGHLVPDELDGRLASGGEGGGRGERQGPELADRVRSLFEPSRPRAWDAPAAKHAAGEQVRVRNHFPPGHNRCPRYVRGRVGTIEALGPPSPLNDLLPEGRLEAHPVYRVTFSSQELWGPAAEDFTLRIDLWEPYLEVEDDGRR